MKRDALDVVIDQWKSARPDLDANSLAVVGRILRLAGIFERRANAALKVFDLPLWAFDVLGTLRRSGKPYAMTPTALMRSTMLTSGAMTNRIDRLEKLELVVRSADPNDRRSLQVRLLPKGLQLVEKAAEVRFREASETVAGLSSSRQKQVIQGLREILLQVEQLTGGEPNDDGT